VSNSSGEPQKRNIRIRPTHTIAPCHALQLCSPGAHSSQMQGEYVGRPSAVYPPAIPIVFVSPYGDY
jgi:hypothetical protein